MTQPAAVGLGELHDAADRVGRGDDLQADEGLADLLDHAAVGQLAGRVDPLDGAVAQEDFVADGRGGLDNVDVVLAFETLLDDLHVQQAEEAATEAEAQGLRVLRDEGEAGVVEGELVEGGPQTRVLGVVAGVEVGEDHLHAAACSLSGRPGPGGRRR